MRIESISDTAQWVAAFRALEEWTMAVRTAVLDELIRNAVRRDNADLVLNLACGLDTRPYRLDLPAQVQWVEVDLPGILDHKERILGDVLPRVQFTRMRADLEDEGTRRKLLEQVASRARRILVLTEGLLVYLPEVAVRSLADDLYRLPSYRWWAFDLVGSNALRVIQHLWNGQLASGNARMQFGPPEGAAFFRPHGWREAEVRTYPDEGARLRRGWGPRLWRYTRNFTPGPLRNMVQQTAAIVRLERT
jgi:methyltransferase (TIGR00027 family)